MTSCGSTPGRSILLTTTIGAQAHLERLLRHEPRLRHRAFVGVDEQQHAVDHAEHALDLAAEVGVARRVDDVDAHALPRHRGALAEDRDAALALEIVGVHRALGDDLAGAERAGLLEQAVDERGLAVVDVRDDRDVTDAGAACDIYESLHEHALARREHADFGH